MTLTDDDRELLIGRPRAEQAAMLLRGTVGPLSSLPFDPDVAALAYLVHLAYRAARRPGEMLAGRPGYEASETLLNRVLSVAQCSGSVREFGFELFARLRLSIAQLRPEDALWWRQAYTTHASRWAHLNTPMILTEATTAARLLDELLWDLHATPEPTPHADKAMEP